MEGLLSLADAALYKPPFLSYLHDPSLAYGDKSAIMSCALCLPRLVYVSQTLTLDACNFECEDVDVWDVRTGARLKAAH